MIDLLRYRLTSPRPPKRPECRYARGERHGRAKLTDAQRAAIPAMLREGRTQRQLARELGVSQNIIYRANRDFGDSA